MSQPDMFPDFPLELIGPHPDIRPLQRSSLHMQLQQLAASGGADVVVINLYCST